MHILVLNAPPGAGKDAICSYLCENISGVFHEEVKKLLFEVAVRSSGVSKDLWNSLYDRRYKEKPCPYLQIDGEHVSPREWMIHCSENVIKPIFGQNAFGKAAVENLKKNHQEAWLVVFSDGGFKEEILELSNYAYETGGKFFLARIHREGCDWGNDSRNWLCLDGIRGYERDFENIDGKMEECAKSIHKWFVFSVTGLGEVK